MALTVDGLRWAQVVAGEAALGAVIKDVKEQLRALPDGLTYGLLRYLNTNIDLTGSDQSIGFNYLGRLGAAAHEMSDDLWRISQDGCRSPTPPPRCPCRWPTPWNSTPPPSTPTPAPICTPTGPGRTSALDDAQIGRLSQLWFDALTGICAHVRHGGGGLTPSDIVPARLTQHQIDELHEQDQSPISCR